MVADSQSPYFSMMTIKFLDPLELEQELVKR
jgi:hypothetical protein